MRDSSRTTIGPSPLTPAPRVRHRGQALLELDVIRTISAECGYNPAALASRLGISTRQLQRLFARQAGCTPRSWLREERLQVAYRLLPRSESIKEVALSLSFRQVSQFCRDFRRRFGYTPSTLKRANEPELVYSASDCVAA